ncbi:MAG: peptide-methionine (S)-S-oxide reductase MsrA [Peptococcaceae bacterium]|nr:peptide-methionine (S)-S-oxide reductase MsrA [Peptococcaceae bacterium]
MKGPKGKQDYQTAIFAGGCFWCMIAPFEKVEGVIEVIPGYTGGYKENPTYHEVCAGHTGHYEAVRVTYDPDITNYDQLLEIFWRQIDPTDKGGQFFDRGSSYRTAVFYGNQAQKEKAKAAKKELDSSGRFNKPVVTAILPAAAFYPAEEYHHNYHKKNPEHYKQYRRGSGRDAFLDQHWHE